MVPRQVEIIWIVSQPYKRYLLNGLESLYSPSVNEIGFGSLVLVVNSKGMVIDFQQTGGALFRRKFKVEGFLASCLDAIVSATNAVSQQIFDFTGNLLKTSWDGMFFTPGEEIRHTLTQATYVDMELTLSIQRILQQNIIHYNFTMMSYGLSRQRNTMMVIENFISFFILMIRVDFDNPPRSYPANPAKATRGVFNIIKNKIHNRYLNPVIWGIGIGSWENAAPSFETCRHYFPEDKNTIWADPFGYESDGKLFVFAEEMELGVKKGKIVCIEFDSMLNITQSRTIIEEEYHLSYPFIFEFEGEIYLMPESSQNRSLQIYKSIDFPWKWQKYHTLVIGTELLDATLLNVGEYWYLFANERLSKNSSGDNMATIRCANMPFGDFSRLHPTSMYSTRISNSRQAGSFIKENGITFRVSQNSSKFYGHAVNVNEIVSITPKNYHEKLATTIYPEPYGYRALHTLNLIGNHCLFDFNINRSDKPKL